MNPGQKASLIILIGIPLLFLLITYATNNWNFFFFSLPPVMVAGITGFFVSKN